MGGTGSDCDSVPGCKGFGVGGCLPTGVCQQPISALVYVMPRGSGCDKAHVSHPG